MTKVALTKRYPPLWIAWSFIGAIVGGAFVMLLTTGSIRSAGISYPDLAAIMLGSVTLVLTVLGLAIAVAAIYGYKAFMDTSAEVATRVAREAANEAATDAIREYVATSAERLLVERAESVALRVITPERLEQLIREHIDAILLGNPADDEFDKDFAAFEAAQEAVEEDVDDDR